MIGPLAGSRYTFSVAQRDDTGRFVLSEREPFGFAPLPDTRIHTVVAGDTLFSLAAKYFATLPRACGFWWVIADFQDPPRIDPTLQLVPGEVLFVPATRVITDVILNEARRRFL